MDKEQARFLLQGFRPDGADSRDPDFAEALALAAEDRELGEWLANERAQDAAFAEALDGIEIPGDLRRNIMAALQGGEAGEALSQMDARFMEALSSVQPPEGLRDQILAAMEVEKSGRSARRAPRRVAAWMKLAPVAAAIVLGVWAAFQVPSGTSPSLVEREAIRFLDSEFTLDLKNPRQAEMFAFLEGNNLPAPGVLPAGLENVDGLGCKELSIAGKPASLLCFMKRDVGVVHLLVLRRDDVAADFPDIASAGDTCRGCSESGWSVANWSDEERAFMLFGKMDPASLAAVF